MNISSIVVKTLPENSDEVIKQLRDGGFCEVHHYENGNIIVTIEGENVSEEIKKLKQIEQTPKVISASMVYSYSEDELEAERDKLQKLPDFPDWMNDDKIEAKDIKYGGDLRNFGLEK